MEYLLKDNQAVNVSAWFHKNRSLFGWGALALGIALIERLVLWLSYPPVSYNDTPSYWRLAGALVDKMHGYDGTRTPGYPFLMALAGNDQHVYLLQLAMGLLMTALFFYIGWRASGRASFGALVALGHTLNLGQLFFEANLITETLATFWLVVMVVGVFIWYRGKHYQTLWLAAIIGLSGAFAALARPLYFFIPVWVAVCLAVSWQPRKQDKRGLHIGPIKIDWRPLVGVLIVGLIPMGLWVRYISNTYGMLSPTTMTGYNLIQHTGYYFEDVPDEYAALRDTYLKYRAERMAAFGTQGNTIWDAIPEMQQVSGLNFYDLSRTLAKISTRLIIEHPLQYLKYAAQGWWMYWRAPVYWAPQQLISPGLQLVLPLLVKGERLVLFALNMFFLLTSIAALVSRKLRETWKMTPFLWFLAATTWVTSILQTLPDHGDNPRFLIPMQSLVVYWGLWVLWQTWQTWKGRKISVDRKNLE